MYLPLEMWVILMLGFLTCDLSYGLHIPLPKSNTRTHELIEDKLISDTLKAVNSGSSMPVLRDITYYRVIEKPYNVFIQHDAHASKVNDNNEDDTERPISNAHGFPFNEGIDLNDTVKKGDDSNEDEVLFDYLLLEDEPDDDKYGGEIKNNSSDGKIDIEADEETSMTSIVGNIEKTKGLVGQTEISLAEQNIMGRREIALDENSTVRRTEPDEASEVVSENKQKTITTDNEQVNSRLRRSTDQKNTEIVPEAPKLSELNYYDLPEYLRRVKDIEKTVINQPETLDVNTETTDDEHENDDDEYNEEFERRLKDMFASIKSEERLGLDENADGIVNLKTTRTRSFGMNLTDAGGFLWNNLWSNPGMMYHVGLPGTLENRPSTEEDENEPQSELALPDEKPNTLQEIDSILDQADHTNILDDLNDIHVPVNKKAKPFVRQSRTEDTMPILPDDSHLGQESPDEKQYGEKLNIFGLLENDRFWNWLTEWTSTYINLLNKEIGVIVKEEISKQKDKNQEEQAINKKHDENREVDKIKEIDNNENEKELRDEENENRRSIFIEGKEIPITSSSNFDQSGEIYARRFKENKRKENKSEKREENYKGNDTKLIAKNIYGSSMGSNSKVVNLYFFFAQDYKNIIDDNIKPVLNEIVDINEDKNVIIDERVNVRDEDKTTEEASKNQVLAKEEDINKKPDTITETEVIEESKEIATTEQIKTELEEPLSTTQNPTKNQDDEVVTIMYTEKQDEDKVSEYTATIEHYENVDDEKTSDDTAESIPEFTADDSDDTVDSIPE